MSPKQQGIIMTLRAASSPFALTPRRFSVKIWVALSFLALLEIPSAHAASSVLLSCSVEGADQEQVQFNVKIDEENREVIHTNPPNHYPADRVDVLSAAELRYSYHFDVTLGKSAFVLTAVVVIDRVTLDVTRENTLSRSGRNMVKVQRGKCRHISAE